MTCTLGCGCDEVGVCYAAAHGREELCQAGQLPEPDALDYADHHGLMREDEDSIEDIYQRAGFDCATHVDAAMQHTCQLTAGLSLLYPDEV